MLRQGRKSRVGDAIHLCRGKVKELAAALEATQADTVMFDDELSPGQLRALEKALGSNVGLCDRTALILDIFSQRAASREGQLQVRFLSRSTAWRARLTAWH